MCNFIIIFKNYSVGNKGLKRGIKKCVAAMIKKIPALTHSLSVLVIKKSEDILFNQLSAIALF